MIFKPILYSSTLTSYSGDKGLKSGCAPDKLLVVFGVSRSQADTSY